MSKHFIPPIGLTICLCFLISCHHPFEKGMDRFQETLAGTWEIRSIAYPSPNTVITYGINPPLIIWEDCEVDYDVTLYCPGEIRDREGDLFPILYLGSLDRSEQSKGGVQINDPFFVPNVSANYNPPTVSPQFNDSLRLSSNFSFELRGDSMILTDGNISGDSLFVENVEVVAVRRE